MKWHERETSHFVKIYFSHEHLWNSKHIAYKSPDRRLAAFKQLIAEFDEATGIELSLTEVRNKVKNLKSTYSQELNKIKLRSGPEYTYKPAMKWFEVWHSHVQSQRKNKNSILEDSYTTDEDCNKMWHSGTENETDADPFEPIPNNECFLSVKPEQKFSNIHLNDEANSYCRNNKKFDYNESIDKLSIDTNVNLMKDDEFDIYGKYIATQLRSMDLQRALGLQIEIQTLIREARLAKFSN